MKVIGKVIKGKGLGYKTANLKASKSFKLANGVYLAKAVYQNQKFDALAIMGIRQDIEIYFLDFDGDLYNQTLEVKILEKLRNLIKHKSHELLIKQIKKDVVKAKEYFNKHG